MEKTLTDIELVEEEALILKAQENSAHFEPLYEKYFERIYTFILHRVNDSETTADITSKVFLKAVLNIKKFKYRGLPLSSWLFRIAINECNEYFRKKKKLRHVVLDTDVIDSLGTELNDETEELERKLRLCIQKLSKKEVELVQLRFFESRAFKEIGEILSITESNAKVKTYRLIDKLRKWMKR